MTFTPRNSLMLHMDSNMHTVNIALNDDFTGGGLFYVKPSWYKDLLHPDVPTQYRNYSWVNSLQREMYNIDWRRRVIFG